MMLLWALETEFKDNVIINVDYGTSKSRQTINVNACKEHLGAEVSEAMISFHSFTGCDGTASFFRKNKSHMFKCWIVLIYKKY